MPRANRIITGDRPWFPRLRGFPRQALTWSSTTSVVVSTSESTDNSNLTLAYSESENVSGVSAPLIGWIVAMMGLRFTIDLLAICVRSAGTRNVPAKTE